MRRAALISALGLTLAAGPLRADEAWDTTLGRIYWDISLGDTAILRLDAPDGSAALRLYLPGLAADMLGDRGTYAGVWFAAGDTFPLLPECDYHLVAPDGTWASSWGTLTLTFVRPEAPSDWAGTYGPCFEEQTEPLSGVAAGPP